MAVKFGEQSSCTLSDEKAGRRPAVEAYATKSVDDASKVDSEQLSRQVGRILEQLITLDEQYRDLIIKHDQSTLEALSACTVALSKLANVRSVGLHTTSSARMDVTSRSPNAKSLSERRRSD